MIVKEDTTIEFSTDEVQETLITEEKMEDDNYMKTAKLKMEQVREENERLKLTLSQMMKDYHSLRVQFSGIIQEDQPKKPTNLAPIAACDDDESELVSLSLGRFSGDSRREEKKTRFDGSKNLENGKLDGLELGLDWKSHSAGDSVEVSKNLKRESSLDESKEEGHNDVRSSHKSPRTSRSGDDDILQHNPLKKPRVSVRAVCNTQTMHDGCQWRKYGQKLSKGNPCPRAYYRCTVSSSCPVRKQVQRCIDDMRILITTYEGTHNHPLPPSATAIASATSAAAAMLNCGSSASPPGHGVSAASSSTIPNPFGFDFTSSNNLTISSSQSHPTVILDLTAPNQNNKFSSSLFSAAHSSPTSLNFLSSSNSSFNLNNTLQIGSMNNLASPYAQPSPYSNIHAPQQQTANDQKTIAAATRAITRDPTFQSALAAAITSFVGSNNAHARNSELNCHLNFSQPSTSNGNIGCATSFLNKFPQSVNSQQKNLTQYFAPLTLSTSKSSAMSLADEGEQIKLL